MAKKPLTIDDPVFGTLAWDALDGAWEAGVAVDHFAEFGRDLPAISAEDDEAEDDGLGGDGDEPNPLLKAISTSTGFMDLLMQSDEHKKGMAELPPDQRAMFEQAFGSMREQAQAADDPPVDVDEVLREGKFLLAVVPEGKKQPPTDAQRHAWAALVNDVRAVADEVMARALEAYRRQRPVRLRWWKAYDDSPARHLPDVKTVDALAKVVRPLQFRVYPGGEIGVQFDGPWGRGGAFGALLRGNEVVAFGPDEVALEYSRKREVAKRIVHPAFGPLRLAAGDEWVGVLRFDPFREYFEIAGERQSKHLFGDEPPAWSPPWDFVEGEFGLTVYAKADGEEPSQAQADAFLAFKADEQKVADDVAAAVFEHYSKFYADADEEDDEDGEGDDDGGDALKATSPADLRELMTLQSVSVHPPRKKKSAAVVLNFSCTWDEEHGMSVLWRDGKIEEVDQMTQVDA